MSQTTKGHSSSSITIKAVIIVIVVAAVYQYYITEYVDEEVIGLGHFSYGIGSLIVAITAFSVAKRYRGSPVFGKTYLVLGIGFVLGFVGDLIYNYYSMVLFEDPYPSIADAFFIAFYFCEIGEYEQAHEALKKEIQNNQKSFDSLFLMGKIQYNLKNYEESLESFNKASEEHNRKHLKHSHKIDHMKNAHKFEEAVKYSDLIYQEKDFSDDFWFHKGKTLKKLGKTNDASICFETIVKNNPKNSNALYELAKIELADGNKVNSLKILEKACSVDSSIKEKLRVDNEFDSLSEERKFREITGLFN